MTSRRSQFHDIHAEEHVIGPDESVTVDLYQPEDGPGIEKLFRAVYGDGYPVKTFYDPAQLAEAFETGENYSVVVRTKAGEVIGHLAIFRSSPYPGLYEAGAGLVLPAYRKAGINRLLLTHLYDRVVPGLGVEEAWGEAVCNHITMQKAVQHYKHVETGLEVDLMPAEAYQQEASAAGRVASVLVFRAYQPKPHSVHLPAVYESELRYLYSGLDDRRNLSVSRDAMPETNPSRVTTETFEFAAVSRIAVQEIGGDFQSRLQDLEQELVSAGTRVVQVWLNLGCPWVGEAANLLRRQGYFLGGLLPRWFDDDGLLMQKIVGRPDWEGIHLFSDRAKTILEMIRRDWEGAAKSS